MCIRTCTCRYKKHVKATEEAHRHTSQMGMVEKAIVDSTKMSKERIHHIMPNEQVESSPWLKGMASLWFAGVYAICSPPKA